jgi:SpoVK/Ycf46/Vps4 family AAA+-type ATPase
MQPSLIYASFAQSPIMSPPITALFYKPPAILEEVLKCLRAESPEKHHAYLSGAPGIGKTAMAEAVHARCMEVRSLS